MASAFELVASGFILAVTYYAVVQSLLHRKLTSLDPMIAPPIAALTDPWVLTSAGLFFVQCFFYLLYNRSLLVAVASFLIHSERIDSLRHMSLDVPKYRE